MHKYFYLFMVTIAEATIGVFVKLTEGQIPIYTLNFYRVLFAFVFLASVVPFIDRQFYKIRKKDIRPILIMGLLITLQISMFNIAMSMAPIANVVIFWSIAPFFVFIFSVLFLKESVNKEHIFIFIIALIGIFIAKPLSGGHTAGNIVALIDGAVYAALVSYMRFENRSESPGLVFWFMLTATVYLSPFLFIFGPGNLNALVHNNAIGLNVPVIVWAICLGMISTGVAYLFMTFSLKNIRANIYSLVDIIVSPIVAATFGYFIFNEVPSSNMIYGGALLLLSGFWLSHYMSGKKSIWHKIFRHYIPVSKEEKKYRSFKYYKQ